MAFRLLSGRNLFWGGLLLALATFLVHAGALDAELVSDDVPYLLQNPSVSTFGEGLLDPFPAQLGPRLGLYRPLTVLSYQLDHQAFALGPLGFHLSSLLIASWMSIVALLILATVTSRPALAFFGAAVFALHPVHVESIAWVSGRSELLAFTLGSAGYLTFLRARRDSSIAFSILAAILIGAAAAAKESGFLWWGVLAAHEVLFPAGRVRARLGRLLWPTAVLLGLWFLRWRVLGAIGPQGQQQAFADVMGVDRLALSARILGESLRLCLWPLGLSIHHPESELMSLGPWAIGSALGFVLATAVGCLFRRARPIAFGGVMFLVLMLPFLHLVPIGESFAERFLLGPSFGLVLIVVAALERTSRSVRAGGLVGLAVVATLLGVLSFRQTRSWQSEKALWDQAARVHPDDPDVLFGQAYAAVRDGREPRVAIGLLSRLLREFPETRPPEVLFNLGFAHEAVGEVDLAATYYRLCAHRFQSDASFWSIERLLNLAAAGQAALAPGEAASLWSRLRATIRSRERAAELEQRYRPLFFR